MASEINITGAAWTNQAATTGTTGFGAVTSLTHQDTTDKMATGSANGVLASGVGATCSFRLGATSGANSPFNVNSYVTIKFKVRLRVELPGSLTADFTVNAAQILNNNTPTGWIFYGSNASDGFFFWVQNFVGGGSYIKLGQPISHNQWHEVTLRAKKANPGIVEYFLNGKRVSYATADYSGMSANFTFSFPAMAGCVWEFDGPFEQWNGTDCPITTPADLLTDTRDDVYQGFLVDNDSDLHVDGSPTGLDCTVSTVSGSVTRASADVATSGVNPAMRYRSITGSGSVDRRTYTWTDLPFDQDWAVIHFPLLYYPSGSSGQVKLYTDSNLGLTLDIQATTNTVTLSGVTQATYTQTSTCSFSLFVNSTGKMYLLTTDQTIYPDSGGGRNTWGKRLPNWNVATNGGLPNKLVLDSTLGASGCRVGPMYIARRLTCIGPDSMSCASANGYTPAFTVGNNIFSSGLAGPCEGRGYPGVKMNYSMCPAINNYLPLFVGRSGLTLNYFVTNVLPGLAELEGGISILIVEGSVNEFASITTIAQAKTAVATLDALDAQLQTWANAYDGRNLIISTIMERSLSTHWSGSPATSAVGVRLGVIQQANRNRRDRFAANPNSNCVLFDPHASLHFKLHDNMINTGNPPHFTGTATVDDYVFVGNHTYYRLLMGSQSTRATATTLSTSLDTVARQKFLFGR